MLGGRKLPIDPYLIAILAMVTAASLVPARGVAAVIAGHLATLVIGLLFFLYGTRLSPQAALAGARHWRLHLTVLLSTFLLFPLLGLLTLLLVPWALTAPLQAGVMFLCCLPSTVQSSIAFTSIARGNVPAALCSASASNLIGILLTPLLVGLLMGAQGGGISAGAVEDIVLQLFLPFAAGQLLRPWLGAWIQRNRSVLGLVDRGSILLVVYAAFGDAVKAGLWHTLTPVTLSAMLGISAVLLASVLAITWYGAAWLGFDRADRTAVLFCGSKKSLISGVPMANILFPGPSVGMILLPLMVFHQIQLMACALLARRLSELDEVPAAGALQPAE